MEKMPCHITDGPHEPPESEPESDDMEECPWCGEVSLRWTGTVQWTVDKAFDEYECECGYNASGPAYYRITT